MSALIYVQAKRRSGPVGRPETQKFFGALHGGFSYHEISERCSWSYTKVNHCASEGWTKLREMQAT